MKILLILYKQISLALILHVVSAIPSVTKNWTSLFGALNIFFLARTAGSKSHQQSLFLPQS
jgi:hypothetical protein